MKNSDAVYELYTRRKNERGSKLGKKLAEQKQTRESMKQTKYAFMAEAASNLHTLNINDIPIDSDEYQKGLENAERCAKTAKAFSDIESQEVKDTAATITAVGSIVATVGMFVADYFFKNPVSNTIKKLFKR